jgi:hypothetical protein
LAKREWKIKKREGEKKRKGKRNKEPSFFPFKKVFGLHSNEPIDDERGSTNEKKTKQKFKDW